MVRMSQHFTLFNLLLSFFFLQSGTGKVSLFFARISKQQVACRTQAQQTANNIKNWYTLFSCAYCSASVIMNEPGCFPRFWCCDLKYTRPKVTHLIIKAIHEWKTNQMGYWSQGRGAFFPSFLMIMWSWASLNYRLDRKYLNVQFKIEADKATLSFSRSSEEISRPIDVNNFNV